MSNGTIALELKYLSFGTAGKKVLSRYGFLISVPFVYYYYYLGQKNIFFFLRMAL